MNVQATPRLEEDESFQTSWLCLDVTVDGARIPVVRLVSHDDPIIIADMRQVVEGTMTYQELQKKWGFALSVRRACFNR